MPKIVKPAVKVQQGGRVLFATSFLVKDFQIQNFYDIDRLDSRAGSGFQRLLQEDRANRLAKYIADSWKENHHALLPTSVFLATEGNVEFNEERNEISFESDRHGGVCPFSVVDGQHRIQGLLRAVEKNQELGEFPIIANIAVNMKEVEQMLQFLIVNTTQKAVDDSVGQQIRSRLHGMLETETLPYMPSWIKSAVEKGSDAEAISILSFLNSDPESPFYRRIQMADEPKSAKKYSIAQKAFVRVLKDTVLIASHPLSFESDKEKCRRIFKNYWIAVKKCFTDRETDENKTIVFKALGARFFCRVSSAVIGCANLKRSYTVEGFEDIFKSSQSHLSDNLLPMMRAGWWESKTSELNFSAIEKKASEFSQAVNRSGQEQQ